MNQYISDWSGAMGDTFVPLGGDDDGLIELLWCNGQVVTQSQGPLRKPPRPDKATAPAVVQDDDAAAAARPWFQYPVVEDPLERDDLFSDIFGEAQAVVDGARTACCKQEADEAARQSSGMMPPPPPLRPREEKACPGPGDGAPARTSAGFEATATEGAAESSMLTIGSSFCGSNHVQTPPPPRARGGVLPGDAATPPGNGKDVTRARDGATATSSATRSRSCTTKCEQPGADAGAGAAAAHRSGKRKQSDAMAAEDVEFESAADVTCQPAAQKTTSAKRRRAAEIHNLSERRRRDRINEKMKALQELIPYCNKTDKASMLDEAIEYLKSLQLQLQMMWMGGGMAAAAAATAPVVFPAGVHQYMQRMVAGPPPHHVSSMPGMPFMAPPPVHQGPPLPDLYARYLAVDHLSPPPPPPPLVAPPPYTIQQHCLQQGTMDFYQRQQNPALPPPTDAVPPAAAAPPDGILHKKYENCGKPEIQGMTG